LPGCDWGGGWCGGLLWVHIIIYRLIFGL
jgi:hypothetical protein